MELAHLVIEGLLLAVLIIVLGELIVHRKSRHPETGRSTCAPLSIEIDCDTAPAMRRIEELVAAMQRAQRIEAELVKPKAVPRAPAPAKRRHR